jgi:hypothetical protein
VTRPTRQNRAGALACGPAGRRFASPTGEQGGTAAATRLAGRRSLGHTLGLIDSAPRKAAAAAGLGPARNRRKIPIHSPNDGGAANSMVHSAASGQRACQLNGRRHRRAERTRDWRRKRSRRPHGERRQKIHSGGGLWPICATATTCSPPCEPRPGRAGQSNEWKFSQSGRAVGLPLCFRVGRSPAACRPKLKELKLKLFSIFSAATLRQWLRD